MRSWAYGSAPIAGGGPQRVRIKQDDARRFTLADVIASSGAAPQLALFLGQAPAGLGALLQRGAGYFPYFTHFAIRDGVPAAEPA